MNSTKDSHDLSDQRSIHSLTGSELSRQQTLPAYDDVSTRSLLHKQSFATTTDYESVKNESVSGEEPRQRNGMSAGIQRLWPKKSVLSQRTMSTFDGNFAHGKPGWWIKQMLVDRSLRSMAAFITICAVIMWIIVFSYLGPFTTRLNRNSTSVGRKEGESCGEAETRNLVCCTQSIRTWYVTEETQANHLFINIAATMILGCSNTYQQLITALKVDEIRWVLSKRGDSKVGTNSPWSINHKKSGKGMAWLGWLLLISTSMVITSRTCKKSYANFLCQPVHFLANSVIGPSFYIHMPTNITYETMDAPVSQTYYYTDFSYSNAYTSQNDVACWTAFRANSYQLPADLTDLANQYNFNVLGNSTTYGSVKVQYTSNCTQYLNNIDYAGALKDVNATDYDYTTISVGSCVLGTSVICQLGNPQPKQCRMNVRMQAAFILGGCLIIKAAYMIILNIRARHHVKNHCLTYGDVIVASVLDPDLKVKNECMLNSGDGYRNKVDHTCHKHCKDPVPSRSGDSIGHCQKCKKFNVIDKAADLPHPSIAIKYKRSLLSNLGSTAITQMIILMFTSVGMAVLSILLIVSMVSTSRDYNRYCSQPNNNNDGSYDCSLGAAKYLKESFGTWGGFSSSATVSSLPPDSLGSEFLAFAISNGAQFLYSLLYLLLIYNLTLVSMEHEWGKWELNRRRPRCTIVSGRSFEQSYFLQLPSRVLLPMMAFAALMHWLLGQAISTVETIYTDPVHSVEHSIYFVRTLVRISRTLTMLTLKTGHLCRLSDLPVDHLHGGNDSGLLVGLHLHSRRVHPSNVRINSRVLCFYHRAH